MRVEFVSLHDPANPQAMSGMPYVMARSLREHGLDIQVRVPRCNRSSVASRIRETLRPAVPQPLVRWLRNPLRNVATSPNVAWGTEDHAGTHRHFAKLAAELSATMARSKADLVFGCFTSTLLAGLQTELPMAYFSDTTAELILASYPELRAQPEGWRRAVEELEQAALRKTAVAAFATRSARDSAIAHYGMSAASAHTIPMGANILPPAAPVQEPFTPKCIRLISIAADSVRKRLDFSIDVLEALRAAGCDATLTAIGGSTARAKTHPHVHQLGQLKLCSPHDRNRLTEALRSSHFLILPSLAEAFGIAPCEAAHAARPSIVSAAGGLSEVVRHGETGLVMPLAASPQDFADALLAIAADRGAYATMCEAALARARAEFTWQRWAERMVAVLEQARAQPTASADNSWSPRVRSTYE